MRKLLIAAVAALLSLGVPAAVAQAHRAALAASSTPKAAPHPVVAPALRTALAQAPAADKLVVFVHGTNLAAARSAVAAAGLTRITDWTSIGVTVAAGLPDQVRAVAQQPGVTYVERDTPLAFHLDTAKIATRGTEAESMAFPVSTTTASSDPDCTRKRASRQARLRTRCGPVTTTRNVGPFDGAGRSIAIVDSGIDGTHPMFQLPDGSSKVVRNMKLACTDDANTVTGTTDACSLGGSDALWLDVTGVRNDTDSISGGGHGTHVASIAAGLPVDAMGRRLEGAAPGARLVGLSVGQTASVFGADSAFDWIIRHHAAPCGDGVPASTCPPITVVNNSYGPVGGGNFDGNSATVLLQRKLVEAGIVVVWANGNGDELNDGGDGSDNRSNPPGQDPTPGVISVANYDDGNTGTRDGALDPSSSRGLEGEPKTYPDISAPGTNITAACRPYLAICSTGFESDPDYGTISGTSMASPMTAGIAAIVQQALAAKAGPAAATPAAVEKALVSTAHKFGDAASYETDTRDAGTGTTSFDKGHGLVDVVNALNSVFGLAPTEPGAAGGSACPAGSPALTDDAGDGDQVGLVGVPPANDPRLDVLGVTMTADPTAQTVTTRFHFSEIDDSDPAGATGMSYKVAFSINGNGYEVGGDRSVLRGIDSYYVGNTSITDPTATTIDATGTTDADANTFTVVAPATAFSPPITGTVTVAGFHAYVYRTEGVLGTLADEATQACPQTLDVGAVPPPPPPAPPAAGTYDAELVPGGPATAWTGSPAMPANAMPDPSLECASPDDPRCDSHRLWVHTTAAGTLHLDVTAVPDSGDDFDVLVFDEAGNTVGTCAESGDEHCAIRIPAGGVYTVAVSGWLATGPYSATASFA